MFNKQLHPLGVLKILMDYSDEENILTQPYILQLLRDIHHIEITRQTFYHSVSLLKDFGFDIETYNDNHHGYCLRKRPFSPEEALFLCHAIEGSSLLSQSEKEAVKEAFLRMLSKPMSQEVLHTLNTHSLGKKNNDILANLRALSRAILQEHKISFSYYHYNINKERVLNPKPFENMEPRFLVNKDSKYYLVTSGGRHNTIAHYRVDRMASISITNEAIRDDFRYKDAYEYAYHSLFMFSGTPVLTRIRCSKHIPNVYDKMLDEFGADVTFEDYDNDWFDIVTRVVPDGMRILAQKYIDAFYVVSPDYLREEVKKNISISLQWYL